jgi:hypothetical protein
MPTNNGSLADVIIRINNNLYPETTARVQEPVSPSATAQAEIDRYLDRIQDLYRTDRKYQIRLVKEKKRSNLPDWF